MGADDESTSWTVIEGAAAGDPGHRETFARVYLPVVRGYLRARWRDGALGAELDDAAQDVFVECLRADGGLARAEGGGLASFRGYLLGITRNVARGFEKRRARPGTSVAPEALDGAADEESQLGRVFDRAFAEALLSEALRRHTLAAEEQGAAALRRVELLRLRLHEGLPIAEIARRWEADPVHLHHQYARARDEFRRALRETLRAHCAADRPLDEAELLELLQAAN